MSVWPPTVEELKSDRKVDEFTDGRDDARLTRALDAAIAFVTRVRAGEFRFDLLDPDQIELPDPTADIVLGTLRLAARWYIRSDSPSALIDMMEAGTQRIPSFDPDIDRLLRLGRHQKARVG